MEKEIKFLQNVESHAETIICPECESEQRAIVEHTWPWWSYVHICTECNYIILESEWNEVKKEYAFLSEESSETQEELWNELYGIIHGGTNPRWYPQILKEFMSKFEIKRKQG